MAKHIACFIIWISLRDITEIYKPLYILFTPFTACIFTTAFQFHDNGLALGNKADYTQWTTCGARPARSLRSHNNAYGVSRLHEANTEYKINPTRCCYASVRIHNACVLVVRFGLVLVGCINVSSHSACVGNPHHPPHIMNLVHFFPVLSKVIVCPGKLFLDHYFDHLSSTARPSASSPSSSSSLPPPSSLASPHLFMDRVT